MPEPVSPTPAGAPDWIAPWPRDWSGEAEPPHADGSRLLRSLPGRRVWLEGDRVWKGFRAERAAMRWRDRWRVRAELRGIGRLRTAGVRTPALAAREMRDGWACLATTAVPGGRSLDRLLRAGLGASEADLDAAGQLGVALAAWARTGLEHRDMHPGNWVLGEDNRWWLLDGHAVRNAGVDGTRRDLARLSGEWRERAPAVWRRRVWRSFRSRLGSHAERLGTARALLNAARADRRSRLERESDRWLRRSEWGCARSGWDWLRNDLLAAPDGPRWQRGAIPADLGRAWLRLLGRAFEHGLPVALPAAWRLEGETLLWILDLGCPLDPAAALRAPRNAAGWEAAWRDRGFRQPPRPSSTQGAPTQTGAAPQWKRRPSFGPAPVNQLWLPAH